VDAQAKAQEMANATYGQGKSALAELTLAEMENQLAAIEATENIIPGYVQALESRIDAQKRLIKAMKDGEVLEANDKTAKKAAEEWERTANKINDSIVDALMRGFESGKDFAKNMRDTIVNMFKTMVLRPVIQAIISPVGAGVASAFGVPGAQAAGVSGSSLGMIGTIKSIYDTGSAALQKSVQPSPNRLLKLAVGLFATPVVFWLRPGVLSCHRLAPLAPLHRMRAGHWQATALAQPSAANMPPLATKTLPQ